MGLLKVENAAFAYGKKVVFENINFTLQEGEMFCLLGPNGSGKTTLLDSILGLSKLHTGTVWLNKVQMNGLKPMEIAKKMAYVPQMQQRTFPYRVIDMVLMGRTAYTSTFSSPTDEDLHMAAKALSLVGMEGFKECIYTNLSGGEGQLVMIARALTQDAALIIMDEPTAHLDFKHEMMILEKIVQLVKERKKSILMATHFPNHALYFENNGLPTKVAMLKDRHIVAAGAPSKVLSEKTMEEVYGIQSKILSYDGLREQVYQYVIPLKTCSQ